MKIAIPLFAAVLASAACSATTASAATRLGTLDCNVGAGVGMLITSSRALHCVFRPSRGNSERYVGTVRRFGLDVGVTGRGRLAWGVFSESRRGTSGSLAGSYVGASGAISAGVGVGANALVGGYRNSVSLQPISVEAQTGISLAAGVGEMRLEAVRRMVRPRR